MDFTDRFQELFQAIYWQAVRRLPDEHARLSPQTIAVLRLIGQNGPLTAAELAQALGRAQSTMSEVIGRVISAGLVARMTDSRDRRRHLIWLTAAGRAALTDSTTTLDPVVLDRMATALSAADRYTLITLLSRLTKDRP